MSIRTRLCIHQTDATQDVTDKDKMLYHYIVDGHATIHRGYYKPQDPDDTANGFYAKHCGGGSLKAIGVALAGGGKNHKHGPIRRSGFEKMVKLIAELCFEYGIEINEKTVYTHYEFGQLRPNTSSGGALDFSYLPWIPKMPPQKIGNYIRNKIKAYYDKL